MSIGTPAYAENNFFRGLPAGFNPILSFEFKALSESPNWAGNKFPRVKLPKSTEPAMLDRARPMFRRLGLRDNSRFDFRLAADDEPKLLEVNPNPAWANDGKQCFMAGFAGFDDRDMRRLISETAIARIARRVD